MAQFAHDRRPRFPFVSIILKKRL